jgi:hypothetical protein
MSRIPLFAALGSFLFATACADADNVLFVTVTNIGIDADTKPPNVTIGYDRYEGYIGPVYENGSMPPVVARLESNLAVFNPEIRQVYATGDAAKFVTSDEQPTPKKLSGAKKVAFVATGTNIGLKVSFIGNAPESFSLGYKRKELSFIPLIRPEGADAAHEDSYASVIASIDMNVNTPSLSDTKLGVSQFFATGIAAEQLASKNPEIRKVFKKIAEQAISLRTTQFTKDESSNKLIDAIETDPTFRDDLRSWIDRQGLSISPTLLIYGKDFAEERKQAVSELLMP